MKVTDSFFFLSSFFFFLTKRIKIKQLGICSDILNKNREIRKNIVGFISVNRYLFSGKKRLLCNNDWLIIDCWFDWAFLTGIIIRFLIKFTDKEYYLCNAVYLFSNFFVSLWKFNSKLLSISNFSFVLKIKRKIEGKDRKERKKRKMYQRGKKEREREKKENAIHGENRVTCQLHDGIPRHTLKKETRVSIYRRWSICWDHWCCHT